MNRSVKVTSTEVFEQFGAALGEFELQMRDVLTQLQLESRRAVEWIEHDRMRYWPDQVRRAFDAVNEARVNLQRCEMASRPEDKRSCTDEKKMLEKAKQRLRLAESKVEAVRRWRVKIKHEVEEFHTHLAKMSHLLDYDTPRAAAELKRMADALDKYVTHSAPQVSSNNEAPHKP